jgi:hypothetical protein|tara:strand:+ start:252 stop:524 length:273 start_codon:yes stop_codon:yes gene_type:complete
MWLDSYEEKEEVKVKPVRKRQVTEIDPRLTEHLKKSMYGFGGSASSKEDMNKAMLTGATIGIMAAIYFKQSPLWFGLGGAVIGHGIAKKL